MRNEFVDVFRVHHAWQNIFHITQRFKFICQQFFLKHGDTQYVLINIKIYAYSYVREKILISMLKENTICETNYTNKILRY